MQTTPQCMRKRQQEDMEIHTKALHDSTKLANDEVHRENNN